MQDYEIQIDDSTHELLAAIISTKDDPFSLAAAADIDPEKFRTFLNEFGKAQNVEALQLLTVAASRRAARDAFKKAAADAAPARSMKVRVKRASVESMTREVSRQLSRLIQTGALSVGTLLPSERTLADSLGVARSVVRGSYEYLEAAGEVKSSRGTVRRMKVAAGKGPSKRPSPSKRSKAKAKSVTSALRPTSKVLSKGKASTEKGSIGKRSAPKKAKARRKLKVRTS